MMQNMTMLHGRQHTRYSLDLLEITGKIILTRKVNILDMSVSGVALKADQRLDLGREYMIDLRDQKGKTISVVGVVVRAELSEMKKKSDEEGDPVYRIGLRFKDGSADAVENFLRSTAHNTNEAVVPLQNDQRLMVRFQITAPNEQILRYPVHFKVRSISLGGMLIDMKQPLKAESTVPLEMTLQDNTSVKIIARISSCNMKKEDGQVYYEIVSRFIDLTDEDTTALKRFMAEWGSFLTSNEKDPDARE